MAINPNPNLPEDILFDIFSRLPTKSIGKIRCLSKPWGALLTSPNFIKSHLTYQTHHENLLLISRSHALHTISTIRDDDETVSEKVNLSNTWSAVMGSCNGLVLLVKWVDDLFLVNPITLEQVKVQDSTFFLAKKMCFNMYGFGYDACSDDYKIVALSLSFCVGEPFINAYVDVYSVKYRAWKRVDRWPYGIPCHSGAYVNGVIHWIVRRREFDYSSVIMAFDFSDERFYEVPVPIGLTEQLFHKLFVLEGCLCIMDVSTNADVADFWILTEYGKEISWTKLSLYPYSGREISKPLCFIGDDEVAFLCNWDSLRAYNFKEDGLTYKVVDGVCAGFTDGCTFTESLVSPAFGNEIEVSSSH